MGVSRKVVLHFPRSLVDQPIMCKLAREFHIDFNILKASVTPKEEGVLVVELSGTTLDYERAMEYLRETGVQFQPLSQDVVRDEARCTHCGVCTALCPTGALAIDPHTRKIEFNDAKCIACGICVLPCPPRAMEIRF